MDETSGRKYLYPFSFLILVWSLWNPCVISLTNEDDGQLLYYETTQNFDSPEQTEFDIKVTPVVQIIDDKDVIANRAKIQAISQGIKAGLVRGARITLDGRDYDVFKGIPYAASVDTPPTRFEKPQPPHTWMGTMNATEYGPACVQASDRPFSQKSMPGLSTTEIPISIGEPPKIRRSEDCLSINVFAPGDKINDTEMFPVMVWIHSGGFQVGTASDYKQEAILRNFVSRRVVFVTFNYRLGPYGFASTGDGVMPGNYGLWDQIEALKWVKENIHNFGGNPNSVTLMGQGTGAASVSILGLSPRAADLFHRMILLSGTAISPGIVRDTAINATESLQAHLACRGQKNHSKIAGCLKHQHYTDVVNTNRPRVIYDDNKEFVPIVDGLNGVIPHPPLVMLENHRKMPILLGTTRDESMLQLVIMGKEGINMSALTRDKARYLVRNLTASYQGFRNHDLITEGCFYEYVLSRNDPAGRSEEDLQNGILDLYSEFWYHAPAARLAEKYSTDSEVYLYSFDHVSEHLFKDQGPSGAFHGSDLVFLFDYEVESTKPSSALDSYSEDADKAVTRIFSEFLTQFAISGNPTKDNKDLNWTTFSANQLNYMSIGERPQMKNGYHWKGHAFWNIYAQKLDGVDIGNTRYILELRKELGDYQLATWVLLGCAAFFFLVLVGLACYCTRKDTEEEEEL